MNEDYQAICDALCETLKMTIGYDSLTRLQYNDGHCNETVSVYVRGNHYKDINVAMDNGSALIRDVMKNL